MTPLETLDKSKRQFEMLLYEHIEQILDTWRETQAMPPSREELRALTQPMVALTDAMHAYRQALLDAAPHVGSEVGEHYQMAARNLPAQTTFLLSTLRTYKRRKTGA